MDFTKDFESNVEELVKQLNYKWFEAKKDAFLKHKQYDKVKGCIRIFVKQGSPNYGEYDEILEWIDTSFEVQLDLRTYCSCYLPIDEDTHWGMVETIYPDQNTYRQLQDLAFLDVPDLILGELLRILQGIPDVTAINKTIAAVLNLVGETVKVNIAELEKEDKAYNEVMADFLSKCSAKVYTQFSRIFTVAAYIDGYQDTLRFNLQQEELAALLYVINEAGMLDTVNYNDTSFIGFCAEHFKFKKKNEYVLPKSVDTLSEKYREIVRGTHGKGMQKIRDKLLPVLKGIV